MLEKKTWAIYWAKSDSEKIKMRYLTIVPEGTDRDSTKLDGLVPIYAEPDLFFYILYSNQDKSVI